MNKSAETSITTAGSLPDWPIQPLRDYMDFSQRLNDVVHLTIRGLGMIPQTPRLLRALVAYRSVSADNPAQLEGGAPKAETIEHSERLAELATREIEEEFPLIHAQAVVSIWAALESLMYTLTAAWILNRPEIIQAEPFGGIKVKIGEYEALENEQRAYYLAELLDQTTAAALRSGVNRFETVFKAIGLSGSLDGEIQRCLFELQKVRNIIVHKRGIADRKFCSECPWLKMIPGQELKVTHRMFADYYSAGMSYATELIYRSGLCFGRDIRPTSIAEELPVVTPPEAAS